MYARNIWLLNTINFFHMIIIAWFFLKFTLISEKSLTLINAKYFDLKSSQYVNILLG